MGKLCRISGAENTDLAIIFRSHIFKKTILLALESVIVSEECRDDGAPSRLFMPFSDECNFGVAGGSTPAKT